MRGVWESGEVVRSSRLVCFSMGGINLLQECMMVVTQDHANVSLPEFSGGMQNVDDTRSIGKLMSVCALQEVHNHFVIAQSEKRLSSLLNVGSAPWMDCLAMEFAFTIRIDPTLHPHRIYDRKFDSFKVSIDRLNSDVMWMDVMSRSGRVWSAEKKHNTSTVFDATIRCKTLDWEMLISTLNNVVTTLQSASVI